MSDEKRLAAYIMEKSGNSTDIVYQINRDTRVCAWVSENNNDGGLGLSIELRVFKNVVLCKIFAHGIQMGGPFEVYSGRFDQLANRDGMANLLKQHAQKLLAAS